MKDHITPAVRTLINSWGSRLEQLKPKNSEETLSQIRAEMLAAIQPGYIPPAAHGSRIYTVSTTNYDDIACETLAEAMEVLYTRYQLNKKNGYPPKLNSMRTMMANLAYGSPDHLKHLKRWGGTIYDENDIQLTVGVTMCRKQHMPPPTGPIPNRSSHSAALY